jgi:hypothetical protein
MNYLSFETFLFGFTSKEGTTKNGVFLNTLKGRKQSNSWVQNIKISKFLMLNSLTCTIGISCKKGCDPSAVLKLFLIPEDRKSTN